MSTTIPTGSLADFEKYTRELRRLLFQSGINRQDERLVAALDGEPGRKLRESVRGTLLRESGTFFTGAKISSRLVRGLTNICRTGAVDPACGAGDLLLAVARNLPIRRTFEETMEAWAACLAGCDIHGEFVTATKLRLCLLALQRGVALPSSQMNMSDILVKITSADGMTHSPLDEPKLVVMNPPYTRVTAPDDCEWAEGLVSSAALFVDRWLELIPRAGRLIALLPDVLRTGSNYRAWRESVLRRSSLEHLEILGRFDQSADVDVFAATFLVGSGRVVGGPGAWKWTNGSRISTVGDRFSVHVGSIVPHRDRKAGRQHAYLNAKAAPPWGTCKRLSGRIRTERTVFQPPCVVVRRTSSPSDAMRAIGTVILGSRSVAVENHLLVLTPYNDSVEECYELIKILKSAKTTKWLNQRIRCRHLTVDAVAAIPWWSD